MSKNSTTKRITTATPRKQRSRPETITEEQLKSLYGPHAVEVLLDGFLKLVLPWNEGDEPVFRIRKKLPDADEFARLQKKYFVWNVNDLVCSALFAFEEMIPEVFTSSVRNPIPWPEFSEQIGAIKLLYIPLPDVRSDASRRDDAVGALKAVVDALQPYMDDEARDDREQIRNLVGELKIAIGTASKVRLSSKP